MVNQRFYSYAVCAVLGLYILTKFRTPSGDHLLPLTTYIGAILLISLGVFAIILGQELKIQYEALPVLILLFGLLFLGIISSLWSGYPALTLQRSMLTLFAPLIMFAVVAADHKPIRTYQLVSRLIIVVGFILSVFGVGISLLGEIVAVNDSHIQTISLGPLVLSQNVVGQEYRIASLLYNPNTLAAFLVLSLPLTTGQYFYTRSFHYLLGIVIQGLALLLTFSRTGLVATMVAIGIILLLKLYKKINIRQTSKALGVSSVLIIAITYNTSGIDRLTSISLDVRERTWRALYTAFLEQPITGTGFGVSNEMVLFQTKSVETSAHSDYFAILAELGMPGVILFISMLVVAILTAIRNYNHVKQESQVHLAVGLSIFVALSIHGLAETTMIRPGFRQLIWSYMLALVINFHSFTSP